MHMELGMRGLRSTKSPDHVYAVWGWSRDPGYTLFTVHHWSEIASFTMVLKSLGSGHRLRVGLAQILAPVLPL